MQIVVLADTHIPNRAQKLPSSVESALRNADLILHAGDLVVIEVLYLLKQYSDVYAVRGNMDHPKLYTILPTQRIVDIGGVRIGMLHGHSGSRSALKNAQTAFVNQNLNAVVFGHSHQPYNQEHQGVLYFNPGSATDKRREANFSYGVLSIEHQKISGKIILF